MMRHRVLCVLLVFLGVNTNFLGAWATKDIRSGNNNCDDDEVNVVLTDGSDDWNNDLTDTSTSAYTNLRTKIENLVRTSTNGSIHFGSVTFTEASNSKVRAEVCFTILERRSRSSDRQTRGMPANFLAFLAANIAQAAESQGIVVGKIEVKYENKKLGHPCTTDTDECKEPNAICDSQNNCVCEPINYVQKFNDLDNCYRRKAYQEVCQFSEQCQRPQKCEKNCSADEACDTVCKCATGSNYIASRSNCYPEANLHQRCAIHEQCDSTVKNSMCLGQLCTCKLGYEEHDGGCRKTSLGGFCKVSSTCRDPNAVCVFHACTCSSADGFVQKPGDVETCYEKKAHMEVCAFNEQCEQSQQCSKPCAADEVCDKVCQCLQGFTYVGSRSACYEDIPLDGSCKILEQCNNSVADSVCKGRKCACRTGYEQYQNGCRKSSLGGVCRNNPNTCREPNALCLQSKCRCNPGSYVQKPGDVDTCYQQKTHMEVCAFNDQCEQHQQCSKPCTADEVCDNVCQCLQGFTYVGSRSACYEDVPLGGPCMISEQCNNSVSDSVCNNRMCVCRTGYEQYGDGCGMTTTTTPASVTTTTTPASVTTTTTPASVTTTTPASGTTTTTPASGTTTTTPASGTTTTTPASGTTTTTPASGTTTTAPASGTTTTPASGTTTTAPASGTTTTTPASGTTTTAPASKETTTAPASGTTTTTPAECPTIVDVGGACSEVCSCDPLMHLLCLNGTCQCEDAYVDVGGTCIERKNFGDSCSVSQQCPQDNTCRGNPLICDCLEGSFTPDHINCYQYRRLGESCGISEQCTDNALCKPSNSLCTCRPNFSVHLNDGNTCVASYLEIKGNMNFDNIPFTQDHLVANTSDYMNVKTQFLTIMNAVETYSHMISLELSDSGAGTVKATYVVAIWNANATRTQNKRSWYPQSSKRNVLSGQSIADSIAASAAASGHTVSNVSAARVDLGEICANNDDCKAFENAECDVQGALCVCIRGFALNSDGNGCYLDD